MNFSGVTEQTVLVADTACQVLETAAFALAERAEPGDAGSAPEELLAVCVDMRGEGHGQLCIAASRELCSILAGDMTGREPDEIGCGEAGDVLGELANMVAGRWATDAWGCHALVQLEVPHPIDIDGAIWVQMSNRPTAVVLLIDDMPLVLDLQWVGAVEGPHLIENDLRRAGDDPCARG